MAFARFALSVLVTRFGLTSFGQEIASGSLRAALVPRTRSPLKVVKRLNVGARIRLSQ